jgi:hypothetical protein
MRARGDTDFAPDGAKRAVTIAGRKPMRNVRRKSFPFIATGLVAALMAGAAGAQTAAPAAKSQKKDTASVIILVTNSRSVALTELDATPSGLFIPKTIVSKLAPGKTASVKVATDKDCVFDLRGVYADDSVTEMPGVDLCKDKNVNLVE